MALLGAAVARVRTRTMRCLDVRTEGYVAHILQWSTVQGRGRLFTRWRRRRPGTPLP